MIFIELHEQERELIRPILTSLIELALKNQLHPQDLYLVMNQGYYSKRLENNDIGLSKYVLGLPGEPGLEYHAAYQFIDEYRKGNLSSLKDFQDYKNSLLGNVEGLRDLEKDELISVQLEQLIYLKFWESNFIIRQFYQLARLVSGEEYDWDFDMTQKSRKKILIELVRNKIEPIYTPFAELFDTCYKSQIRNAIAHSLFYIIGDTIILTNHRHNTGDELSSITFADWKKYIHKTLVIFDEMIRLRQEVDKHYSKLAQENGNKLVFRLKTKSHDELRSIKHFPGEMNQWGEIELHS